MPPHRLTLLFAIRGFALLLVGGLIASCGGDVEEPARPAASTPTATATPETTETATRAASLSEADITAAEQAVKNELPDIPLWKGARFDGQATSEVCVDRVITKESADAIGSERTSHVVVALPDLSTGEPQDGPCAKADENADEAIEAFPAVL